MRVSFRVNENKDKDIYEALENCADITKEVKKLIRRGMMYTPPDVVEKVKKELDDYSFEENDDLNDKGFVAKRKKTPVSNAMQNQIEIEAEDSRNPHQESSIPDEELSGNEVNNDEVDNGEYEEYEVDENEIIKNLLDSF